MCFWMSQGGLRLTDLAQLHARMTGWRRDLHRHPEFGFEEQRTAAFVAYSAGTGSR